MEEKTKKNNLIPEKDLNGIRETLPFHYYGDFKRLWKKENKGISAPSRQTVYKTLKGDIDNMDIINTLLQICQERASIKDEVRKILNHAQQ